MKYLLVPLLALTLPLTACVVPPSKAYDASQQANVAILDDGALNIDIIKPVSFKVDSKKTWQNTGRFMENGDMVNITANGSWSPAAAMNVWSGPEGNILWSVEVAGIPGGALMAKIGHDGKPFLIGTTRTFRAQDYGMLYLAMNDSFSYLFDNQGEIEAEIYSNNSGTASTEQQGKLEIVSYQYDADTGNGSLSARLVGDHFKVRQRMINKIGEIASTKNDALRAGKEKLQGGNYELLGESSNNGIMTLNFKALW